MFESILNHILTIKHLRITVDGEYTYSLPQRRFLLEVVDYSIQHHMQNV